jgi:phage tail-like protein
MAGKIGDRREDPLYTFRFHVEIDGSIEASFSEASGLQVEVETEDFREGGVNDFVYKLPTVTKYPNLILKRGMTNSDVLWKWHRDVVDGKIERKSGRVILLDFQEDKQEWVWTFENAFPVKWTGPEFKGDQATLAIEALELVHTGIKKV